MSQLFFEELSIKAPFRFLGIGGKNESPAIQTAGMIAGISEVIASESPKLVLVYGDTNSTLAGAIAALKCGVKLAHVEAGLRSFNKQMPEERNRIITDHCSDLLFCPTRSSVEQLSSEGISEGVFASGDVMVDSVLTFSNGNFSELLEKLGLKKKGYFLVTLHRQENVDDKKRLNKLIEFLNAANRIKPVLFLVHPRTRRRLTEFGLSSEVMEVEPEGYPATLFLLKNSSALLTDSGGMQKEAGILSVPCITLRSETEWKETLKGNWNRLWLGEAAEEVLPPKTEGSPFGWDSGASKRIASVIWDFLK